MVCEIADGAFQFRSFVREGAGGFNGAGVFGPQEVDPAGAQRQFPS